MFNEMQQLGKVKVHLSIIKVSLTGEIFDFSIIMKMSAHSD